MVTKITLNQSIILRLLKEGEADVNALTLATDDSKKQVQNILNKLVGEGLVERRLVEGRVLYKARGVDA